MNQEQESIEDLWDNLLSRNPKQILEVFAALDELQQKIVQEHLSRMACKPGWHPEQRLSAQSALKALDNWGDQGLI